MLLWLCFLAILMGALSIAMGPWARPEDLAGLAFKSKTHTHTLGSHMACSWVPHGLLWVPHGLL